MVPHGRKDRTTQTITMPTHRQATNPNHTDTDRSRGSERADCCTSTTLIFIFIFTCNFSAGYFTLQAIAEFDAR